MYFNQWNTSHPFPAGLDGSNALHGKIVKECENRFKSPDCYSTLYVKYSNPEKSDEKEYKNASELILILRSSHMPVTRIVYSPSISLIDFIVYILSTISFWLNVAPLSILFDIYDRILRKIETDRHGQSQGQYHRNRRRHADQIQRLRTELNAQDQRLNEQERRHRLELDTLRMRMDRMNIRNNHHR